MEKGSEKEHTKFESGLNEYGAWIVKDLEVYSDKVYALGRSAAIAAIESGISPLELEAMMISSLSLGFSIERAKHGCQRRIDKRTKKEK